MTSEGYRTVFFHGKHCLAHRIVFALTAGKWPENEIDHINGAPTDNRPENLREATRCKNGQNRKVSRNNTSGHKGVSWNSQAGKWEARIRAGNHIHRLGYFADIEAAASAYRRAAERLFGDFQRMAA